MFMIATIQMIVSGIPTSDGRVWMPRNGNVKGFSTQHAGTGRHGRREDPTRELPVPRKTRKSSTMPTVTGNGGAEQQPARVMADAEKGECRHEHPEEESDTAEAPHRELVDAPPAGDVDHAEPARHPTAGVRQNDDGEGDERSPEGGDRRARRGR